MPSIGGVRGLAATMHFLRRLGLKALFLLTCLLSLGHLTGMFHPHLELLSHFKLQFVVILASAFALMLILQKRRRWVVLAMLVLGLNLFEIVPWYVPAYSTATLDSHSELKVLLANVYANNAQTMPIAHLIASERPDLIVLQEANAGHLALLDGMQHYPYRLKPEDYSPYGLAIWSRYPLDKPAFMMLGDAELPSISARLKLGQAYIHFTTTHLSSPIRKAPASRNRQLQALSEYMRKQAKPQLLLGDFNISMWSPYYKNLENQTGLQNCRKGFGILPSWPTQLPEIGRIPIDHCLVSDEIRVKDAHLGMPIGSDHLPLVVTLNL